MCCWLICCIFSPILKAGFVDFLQFMCFKILYRHRIRTVFLFQKCVKMLAYSVLVHPI